jgi:HEAT repeat protein
VLTAPPIPAPSSPPSPTLSEIGPTRSGIDDALLDLEIGTHGRRMLAISRLAGMKPTRDRARVSRALEPLLKDQYHFTRAAAARALKTWATPESVPLLIPLLQDEQHSVRWAALDTLGGLKDPRAAEPVAELLHRDRGFAGQALRAMGPVAAPAALRRLDDPEWTVRIEVCRILKEIGGTEHAAPLKALLEEGGIVAMAAEDALRAIHARQ